MAEKWKLDHITDEQLAQDAAKAAEGHEAQLKAEQEARDKRQRSRRLKSGRDHCGAE